MTDTNTHIVNDQADSIEIGTPAKGGTIKVYFDANKPEEAKQKIKNVIALREFMQKSIEFP